MTRKTLQAALCFCLSPLLVAQESVVLSASRGEHAPRAGTETMPEFVSIRKGTELPLVTLDTLSSATAKNGQTVKLAVSEDLIVDGIVTFPKGTAATGVITHLRKAVPGKSDGYLEVKPIGMTMPDGRSVKLSDYPPGEDACANAGPCWVLWTLFGPIGMI